MRTALRLTSLCLALAATAPAVALAGPPAPSSKPAPKGPAAKPPAKETMSDGDAVVMLVILGAVVVLGGGGFVAWRLLSGGKGGEGKGDGRPVEPILPERTQDWELRLTAEQEGAMLRGIQAYRDGGHSLYLSHRDALITFYEPRLLVSLHHLTDLFMAAGPAGLADPVGLMRSVLDGCVASESPGVLHLQKGWYTTPVDGLDFEKFTTLCHDTLTCPQPYIEGTQGSSSDENSGNVTVNVEVGGPLNTFCVDLRRVLPLVHEARRTRPQEPLIELVRPALQGMLAGAIPGGMWTRGGALPPERELMSRIVATSAPRAR
jgi:hypothetical protein